MGKSEELLGIEGLMLPAAGATNTARQVASLSALTTGKAEAPPSLCVFSKTCHRNGSEM